jgi:hypothetical protein
LDYPAIIEVEVAGKGIDKVRRLTIGDFTNDRQILLDEMVLPPGREESQDLSWTAGVYELAEIWVPEAYYLTNGTDGMFVTTRVDPIENEFTIAGHYRTSDGDSFQDVELTYSGPGERPLRIRTEDLEDDLTVEPGAEFLAINRFLDDQNVEIVSQAISLTFDDEGKLVLEKRPLDEGNYSTVFVTDSSEGYQASDTVILKVAASDLDASFQTVVHPTGGFQLAIPSQWSEPIVGESWMRLQDPLESIELAITIHPEIGNNGPEELSGMVLQHFGSVSILYQDRRSVRGQIAHRTIYGYDADQESHTGIFATLVSNGTGYIIDLDGQNISERDLQKLANNVLDSWQYRPPTNGDESGDWLKVKSDNLSFSSPSSYIHERLDNGWDRITSSDGRSFLAMRIESKKTEALEDRLVHWQQVAEQQAPEFVASKIEEVSFFDQDGKRVDFEYLGKNDVTIYGIVLAQDSDFGNLIVWAEAPEQDFDNFVADLLMPVVASLSILQ